MVMKLSEAQLRPLYARLREWKGIGGLDDGEHDEKQTFSPSSVLSSLGVTRRYAFWSLSAALGKELRSIFLPLLTSVISDVVDELVSLFFI